MLQKLKSQDFRIAAGDKHVLEMMHNQKRKKKDRRITPLGTAHKS